MIGLGIWQLERRRRKMALLATYAAAANQPPIGWPVGAAQGAAAPVPLGDGKLPGGYRLSQLRRARTCAASPAT